MDSQSKLHTAPSGHYHCITRLAYQFPANQIVYAPFQIQTGDALVSGVLSSVFRTAHTIQRKVTQNSQNMQQTVLVAIAIFINGGRKK